MKPILKAVALVGTFGLVSGVAIAEQHEPDGVDTAHDPTDVPYDPDERGKVDPGEPVKEGEAEPSANDPDDTMIDPEGKVENGEVVPESGVDSANDPED
ncbi:hypothetical protein GLV89_08085 [Halomonas alkaliantarctica]|nr:hypothetical protein [Halomonas alkaliantarctica]